MWPKASSNIDKSMISCFPVARKKKHHRTFSAETFDVRHLPHTQNIKQRLKFTGQNISLPMFKVDCIVSRRRGHHKYLQLYHISLCRHIKPSVLRSRWTKTAHNLPSACLYTDNTCLTYNPGGIHWCNNKNNKLLRYTSKTILGITYLTNENIIVNVKKQRLFDRSTVIFRLKVRFLHAPKYTQSIIRMQMRHWLKLQNIYIQTIQKIIK